MRLYKLYEPPYISVEVHPFALTTRVQTEYSR